MPTTSNGIWFPDGSSPQEIDTLLAAVASSVDSAVSTIFRSVVASRAALPAPTTPGLVVGKSHAYVTGTREEFIWAGGSVGLNGWLLIGGGTPQITQRGTATPTNTGNSGSVSGWFIGATQPPITFATPFTAIPNITMSPVNGDFTYFPMVVSKTTTSFTYRIIRLAASPSTACISDWAAHGLV